MTFVGRQPELAALRAARTRATAGDPQIVLLSGPPGVGKTALVEQFLAVPDLAPDAAAGPAVLAASGEQTETLLRYGVVDQLARAAGPAGRELTAMLAAAELPEPITVGTRLLDLLDRADAGSGVLLLIDDAHWADRDSLLALLFALRRLMADPVMALLTVREADRADLPEGLVRLASGPRGHDIRLRGLDDADLGALAESLGVHGVTGRNLQRLRESTRGNPLHARALLEEFPPSRWRPEWAAEGSDLPAPQSFRRLVQDRLAGTSEAARRLVEAASIAEPRSPLTQVAGLAALDDPLPALDEAVAADLLEVGPGAPLLVAFPHPLVRSAVYEQIPVAQRRDLHRSAADLTTERAGALRHRMAAADRADDELAAELSRFADEQAARQEFHSGAMHLVAAGRFSTDPRAAHERVLRAVTWMVLRGDAATATTFRSEIAGYESGPLLDLALGALAMAADDPARAEQHLERAWAARDGLDDETVAIIALITGIHWFGRLAAAATVEWCSRARDLVDPHSPLHAVALSYLLHGLGYAGRRDDAAREADGAEARPGDPLHRWANPRSARGLLHLVDDEIFEALDDFATSATAASGLGMMNTAAFSWAYLARTEWVAGRWDDAIVHADRAMAINLESDLGFQHTAITGIAALVPAGRGDWATAQSLVRSMTHGPNRYERAVVAAAMAGGRLGEAMGDPAAVLTALEPVRAVPYRDGADEPGFWPWADLYAEALVAVGRTAEADRFLRPHEEMAAARGRRTAMARAARARGRVLAAQGDVDGAEATFQRGLELLDGLTTPFERARIEFAAGAVLRRAGRRRKAAALLADAHERFAALGAVPYVERCAQELAASGLTPTRRTARDRVGLTAQEVIVARLAAAGRSNRQIADELVVSIKTVEYHLRNAFTKLDVTSRRQLPERMAELAGPD